jgi:hypothetical protein
MSTELETVSKALANIDAVRAGLAQLRERYAWIVYEVTTTAGMDEAKAARLAIREPRYSVERIRKAAKKPILDLGKKLDAQAARIEAELLEIEQPIHEQIANEEARKDHERQARIDAEMKRQQDTQARIAELRGIVSTAANCSSELIGEHIGDIERIPIDDTFEEFRQQAEDAKTASLSKLHEMHAAAVIREEEQAELARLRAEKDEREARERAEREERERQEQTEERAVRERSEGELAERQRQQREAQERIDTETKRLANERAAFERQQAEARRIAQEAEARRVAEEAAAQKRRDAEAAAAKATKFPGELAII